MWMRNEETVNLTGILGLNPCKNSLKPQLKTDFIFSFFIYFFRIFLTSIHSHKYHYLFSEEMKKMGGIGI